MNKFFPATLASAAISCAFANEPTRFSECAQKESSLVFSFGGDVTPVGHQWDERRFDQWILKEWEGRGYSHASEGIRHFFSTKTYNIVNLETSVLPASCKSGRSCSKSHKTGRKVFYFGAPKESLELLASMNIRAVTVANNHALDFGEAGLSSMLRSLEDRGILAFGVDGMKRGELSIAYDTYKNIRIALIGSSFLSWDLQAEKARLTQTIRKAKVSSDLVVVYYHWGDEGRSYPNASQKELARVAIETGWDLIVGSHPHVVQPGEIMRGPFGKKVPVRFSFGNFIFAGNLRPSRAIIEQFCFEKMPKGIHFAGSRTIPIMTGISVGNFAPQTLSNYASLP